MRIHAPTTNSSSTDRWLSEGFSLERVLALDVLSGGTSPLATASEYSNEDTIREALYLGKVCAKVDIQDSYYCCGYEIEQALMKSINRIGQFLGTGKNVLELRGLPGSGCTTLSVLCGHLLRNTLQQPEDAKDTFDGITWPKVLYLSLQKPNVKESVAAGVGEVSAAAESHSNTERESEHVPMSATEVISSSLHVINGHASQWLSRGSPLPTRGTGIQQLGSAPPTSANSGGAGANNQSGSVSSNGGALSSTTYTTHATTPRKNNSRNSVDSRVAHSSDLDGLLNACALAWTQLNMAELTSCIRRWFLYHSDEYLTVVIDDAEPLCHNWQQAQISLNVWMNLNRLNLILVNQSGDIFRPVSSPRRCVIRIAGLEPEQVMLMLQNTRAKRKLSSTESHSSNTPCSAANTTAGRSWSASRTSSLNKTVSMARSERLVSPMDMSPSSTAFSRPLSGAHSSSSQVSYTRSSCGGLPSALDRNTSALEDYSGNSVMELLSEYFMSMADYDEVMANKLVVRWCMMMTGGLPKRIKLLCDSTLDLARKGQPFDPHDTPGHLFTHVRPLFADLNFQRRLANLTIAAQVDSYTQLSELVKHHTVRDRHKPASLSKRTTQAINNFIGNSPLTFTPACAGVTGLPTTSSSGSLNTFGGTSMSSINYSNMQGLEDNLPPNVAVSEESLGLLIKAISLQKSPTPIDDRHNTYLHDQGAIAYDDDILISREWLVRNQERVVICSPEICPESPPEIAASHRILTSSGVQNAVYSPIRANTGSTHVPGYYRAPSSRNGYSTSGADCQTINYRDLISFAPFMLYTHHPGLRRIAQSYIRFSPGRSYHKGIFSWLSYRLILLPFLSVTKSCGPMSDQQGAATQYSVGSSSHPSSASRSRQSSHNHGQSYVQIVEAALIAGTHSWLDRYMWTHLLHLIYKIVTRHSSVWEYSRYKRLAIYSGFRVPAANQIEKASDGRHSARSRKPTHPRSNSNSTNPDSASYTWLKFDTPIYQIFSKSCHKINVTQYNEIIVHGYQSALKGIVTIVLEAFTKHILIISASQTCIYDVCEDPDRLAQRFDVVKKIVPKVLLRSCSSLYPDFL